MYGLGPGNLTRAVEGMKAGQTHTGTEKLESGSLGPQMGKLQYPGSSVCLLHKVKQERQGYCTQLNKEARVVTSR